MELFDKQFVYLEWDDVLKGKKVFVGNTLSQLRTFINGTCSHSQEVSKNVDDESFYPFVSSSGMYCSMVYYDPNYECKRAYAEGKTIQCRNKGEDKWIVTSNPSWLDRCEYRVKPEPEMWTTCIDDEGVVSIMPAREWNKNKGRQLINDTEEECKDYAVENYCKKCIHEVSICCSPRLGCQCFRENEKKEEHKLRVYKCSDDTLHISNSCIIDFMFDGTEEECKQYIKEHYCDRCAHQSCDMAVSTQFCKGFKKIVKSCGVCKYNSMSSLDEPCVSCTSRICLESKEVKKRRMTNREFSKWLAHGNGEWTDKSKDPFQIHCFIYQNTYSYEHDTDNAPVKKGYMIRGWDETEWHEPEAEE